MFFLFFCAHFNDGLLADGITAMVLTECFLIYIALGMVPQLPQSYFCIRSMQVEVRTRVRLRLVAALST